MMRKVVSLLVLSIVSLSAAAVHAQTTKAEIPFSGTATGQGSLGSADLTFRLWNAVSGGTYLSYSDSQAGVYVYPDDSFGAVLGTGTGGDVPPSIFAANPSIFIAVELTSIPGVEIGPRVPIFSSGYAHNAASLGKPGTASIVAGSLSLDDSTASSGNILKGGVPFLHNFGTQNTFLGTNAGNLTTSGLGKNTAIGFQALALNTQGSENTAAGAFALRNSTGAKNTAVGAVALGTNTTGSNNTATGSGALLTNSVGSNNTANGANALGANTTGTQNTAIGAAALFNSVGNNNTATGANALRQNATGFNNTANGEEALRDNITGTENTAVGTGALAFNLACCNTGIGSVALISNTSGLRNTASGFFSLAGNTTGNFNTASGVNALRTNTTGSSNTAIGDSADVASGNLSNATAIGYGAVVNQSNKVRLGNSGVTVIEGQVPFSFTSDKTKKENFKPVDGEKVLQGIRGLSLTSWNYIGHDPKQFRHYGPMAQDFFAAFGDDGVGTIGTPTTINSGDIAGVLMLAVQALERRTSDLMAAREENAELKARVDALERSVTGL